MTAAPAYPHEAAPTGRAAAAAERFRALVPELVTARLVLRAMRMADFKPFAGILCSDRARHVGGPMDRESAWREFTDIAAGWLLRGHGGWTVADKAGTVVGFVLVHMEPGDREPELGFLFTEAAEGRGYATEAAAAARDHALKTLRLDALVSYVDPPNSRSAAVARRLGAWRDEAADFGGVDVWRHWPPADDGSPEAYA